MNKPLCFGCKKQIETITCYTCSNCKTIYCQDCNKKQKSNCFRCKPRLTVCVTNEIKDTIDREYGLYKRGKENYSAKYKCPRCGYKEGIRETIFRMIKSLNTTKIRCYACGYANCEIEYPKKELKKP